MLKADFIYTNATSEPAIQKILKQLPLPFKHNTNDALKEAGNCQNKGCQKKLMEN